MPHFKILRRLPGTSCAGDINATNPCFETIAFVDLNGPWHQDIGADAVTPSGECGYSQAYLSYDQADRAKMYLIVKDNQVRATYESPLSRRQVTVMNFDLSKYSYAGGRVGIFMFVPVLKSILNFDPTADFLFSDRRVVCSRDKNDFLFEFSDFLILPLLGRLTKRNSTSFRFLHWSVRTL